MRGWYFQSHRHSLAAKGIKTSFARKRQFDDLLRYVGEQRSRLRRPLDFDAEEEQRLREEAQSALTQQRLVVGAPSKQNKALWLAVGDPSSKNIKQLAFAHWDASLLNAPLDYERAIGVLQPYVERKAAEHGQLSKEAYIRTQLDAIKRKRMNDALALPMNMRNFISLDEVEDLPESFVPMSPSPGAVPGGRYELEIPRLGGPEDKALMFFRKSPVYFVDSASIEREFPEGLTLDDFKAVREKYLRVAGDRGAENILSNKYESGELSVPAEYSARGADYSIYLRDLVTGNRNMTPEEVKVVFDELYNENKRAHKTMPEFKMMAALALAGKDERFVKDPKYAPILFDQMLSAQHVTGSVFPYDVPSLRKEYAKEFFRNEAKASRNWVAKKKWNVLKGGKAEGRKPSDFDQKELAMGIRVEMEHTNDKRFATEIAMDHLAEYPGVKYYTELAKMEKRLEAASLGGKK